MDDPPYIWNQPGWPDFILRREVLTSPLARARLAQATVLGMAHAIGLSSHAGILEDIWVSEAIATAGIEGVKLNLDHVRSSVSRKLGLADHGASERNVEGLVDVMDDAGRNFAVSLTHERLCKWQAALFPTGRSGLVRIAIGKYRGDLEPMRIVSGRAGREKVHYVAPPAFRVHGEMTRFIEWFHDSVAGRKNETDGLVRTALAHLWFETIHPFEDGNGRVGRALCDLALAQDASMSSRIYCLSRQLQDRQSEYYDQLNAAQSGDMDVTRWVAWFIAQFEEACAKSAAIIRAAVGKSHFWQAAPPMNERQKKAVQRLLDAGPGGFEGGMSAEKYCNLTGASKATATRDLADLAKRGVLEITGRGRGTRYAVRATAP